MGKKYKQKFIDKNKKTYFGLNKSYSMSSVITDTDMDNSYEMDSYIYDDSHVINCLNYILNVTFSRIEFENEEQKRTFYDLLPQFQQFLVQYLVDGYSFNIETITLKNRNIDKKLYYNKQWHILYKTKEYNGFTSYEYKYVYIGKKNFAKDVQYDKFIDTDYLVWAKSPVQRYNMLLYLTQMKKQIMDILQLATQKTVIPPIIMTVDTIDDNLKQEMLDFISGYKNASASVVNAEYVKDIKVVDPKVNESLLFDSINMINEQIASLLGLSNSIFTGSRTYSYTTITGLTEVSLRNINSYRKVMENVINEIAEKNNLKLKVEIPELMIDEYFGDDNVKK